MGLPVCIHCSRFFSFYDFLCIFYAKDWFIHLSPSPSLSAEAFLSCELYFLRGMNSYLLFCGWNLSFTLYACTLLGGLRHMAAGLYFRGV